jgi:hypothetical protein
MVPRKSFSRSKKRRYKRRSYKRRSYKKLNTKKKTKKRITQSDGDVCSNQGGKDYNELHEGPELPVDAMAREYRDVSGLPICFHKMQTRTEDDDRHHYFLYGKDPRNPPNGSTRDARDDHLHIWNTKEDPDKICGSTKSGWTGSPPDGINFDCKKPIASGTAETFTITLSSGEVYNVGNK